VIVAETDATEVGFTGHDVQKVGAILLARYRAYDPDLGRWLSADPIGDADGPNVFAYVHNKPTGFVDPDGRAAAAAVAVAGAAAWVWKCYSTAIGKADASFPGNDKKKHCYASCSFNRCMLLSAAAPTLIGGIAYEVAGGWRPGDSAQDIRADAEGIANSFKVWKSCETLCDGCSVK
jgi:RHS repeat-associated protein